MTIITPRPGIESADGILLFTVWPSLDDLDYLILLIATSYDTSPYLR